MRLLLSVLDVHPRVAMQILWHSKNVITMETYTEVPSAANPRPRPGACAADLPVSTVAAALAAAQDMQRLVLSSKISHCEPRYGIEP